MDCPTGKSVPMEILDKKEDKMTGINHFTG